MSEQSKNLSALPMNALNEIPEPRADAQPITALVKEHGRTAGYQLADGRVLSKEEGIQLAKDGGIQGVGIANRNGNPYLKSLPDNQEGNNLSHLPSVSR